MLQVLHQQTGNRMVFTFLIQRQRNGLDQVFQRHMPVDRPAPVAVFVNIVTGIDLFCFIRQITGDSLHDVAERHNSLYGPKFIDHKGEVGSGSAELLQRRKQRQRFREHQRLTNQNLQIERFMT